jgi:hypothetical protein
MNRTTFLIDGFNLYHSLNDACRDLRRRGIKWLNINKFCLSYIPHITPRASLEQIYYFTAFAYHRQKNDPHIIQRHKLLIECLTATGVNVEMGRFKAKQVYCNGCRTDVRHYEEKETDVAISAKLLELFFWTNAILRSSLPETPTLSPPSKLHSSYFLQSRSTVFSLTGKRIRNWPNWQPVPS